MAQRRSRAAPGRETEAGAADVAELQAPIPRRGVEGLPEPQAPRQRPGIRRETVHPRRDARNPRGRRERGRRRQRERRGRSAARHRVSLHEALRGGVRERRVHGELLFLAGNLAGSTASFLGRVEDRQRFGRGAAVLGRREVARLRLEVREAAGHAVLERLLLVALPVRARDAAVLAVREDPQGGVSLPDKQLRTVTSLDDALKVPLPTLSIVRRPSARAVTATSAVVGKTADVK